jgi:glycogen debranching enzyme
MPIELKVSPPGITISQGRTFMVTDPRGEIHQQSEEGVYAIDTRFISGYQLFINGQPWTLVTSSSLSFYAARIYLTNPVVELDTGPIPANTICLEVERQIGEGIHEDFIVTNYTGKHIHVLLELDITSDFADIFEVKAKKFVQRGRMQTHWDEHKRTLHTTYTHEDFHRSVSYCICDTTAPVSYANGKIAIELHLAPLARWETCGEITLEHGQEMKRPLFAHSRAGNAPTTEAGATPGPRAEPLSDFDARQGRWQTNCTAIETPNEHVYRMYRQAVEDMGALRIYDLDVSDEAWVPAAGVPWFVTLFGRDSLIVALQTMSVSPAFARGALKRLAEYQAQSRDDYRDAQPGKILHEIRFGELAHFQTIPFTPYYGTADATILYLIVLSETYRWTGDRSLLTEYRSVAEKCLDWIDTYGDLDGDGFQEYRTYSSLGYENIGWKDAGDAVVYADGTQVKQPKALCELQGYVYDAKTRMAEIYDALGEPDRAQMLRDRATALKLHFNEAFWVPEESCFAFGLDPQKRQITSVSSNAGHCLWSGIADHDKAMYTAHRLLQPDMWSGWGIRTISSKNPAYNPFSYHLGSVWPHDNGIIAAGFKRYDMTRHANQVIRGIFDAARRFEAYRLPEIFAGLPRLGKKTDFPALYPGGANIPQAWASGAIFQMLQAILGLRADAPHKRLYVHPSLPEWLPAITLEHLRVGNCSLHLRFWREDDHSHWEVVRSQTRRKSDAITVVEDVERP